MSKYHEKIGDRKTVRFIVKVVPKSHSKCTEPKVSIRERPTMPKVVKLKAKARENSK